MLNTVVCTGSLGDSMDRVLQQLVVVIRPAAGVLCSPTALAPGPQIWGPGASAVLSKPLYTRGNSAATPHIGVPGMG